MGRLREKEEKHRKGKKNTHKHTIKEPISLSASLHTVSSSLESHKTHQSLDDDDYNDDETN